MRLFSYTSRWDGWDRDDARTWRARQEAVHGNWANVMDGVIEAFMGWKYPSSRDEVRTNAAVNKSDSVGAPPVIQTMQDGCERSTAPSTLVDSLPESSTPLHTTAGPRDSQYDFAIRVVDVYTLESIVTITPPADSKSGAAALVMQGYIGASPVNPTLAISIKTLELFRRLRLRKASFSVEAFAKVICDYYMVCLL